MKIIALVPFKNEEWILPTYLSNVLPVVDEIIGIDDGSTDNSRKIMEDAGVKLIDYNKTENIKAGWHEYTIRSRLHEAGRESGGTHFVCLDADETFTSNFVPHAREIISSLEPGQKLAMQWLALWKSYKHYRHDETVWSNNWKDFVVADHQDFRHDDSNKWMHVGRTPGNQNNTWLRMPNEHGAVLHYQFSVYNNFQLKQSWLRVCELVQGKKSISEIISQYSITTLDENVGLVEMPSAWTEGVPEPKIQNFDPEWNEKSYLRKDLLPGIMGHFDEHGVEFFEDLDIWHIPQLHERFVADTGRQPK